MADTLDRVGNPNTQEMTDALRYTGSFKIGSPKNTRTGFLLGSYLTDETAVTRLAQLADYSQASLDSVSKPISTNAADDFDPSTLALNDDRTLVVQAKYRFGGSTHTLTLCSIPFVKDTVSISAVKLQFQNWFTAGFFTPCFPEGATNIVLQDPVILKNR